MISNENHLLARSLYFVTLPAARRVQRMQGTDCQRGRAASECRTGGEQGMKQGDAGGHIMLQYRQRRSDTSSVCRKREKSLGIETQFLYMNVYHALQHIPSERDTI